MKKKIIIILTNVFIFTVGIAVFIHVPHLFGKCGENVKWTYNSFTETLTVSGEGEMYDYGSEGSDVSPMVSFLGINGYSEPTTVIIEEGVTKIGDFAFFGMNCIDNIVLPEGLTHIGEDAFAFNDISSLSLPESLEHIGEGAFRENKIGNELIIPEMVSFIGKYAFYKCGLIEKAVIRGEIPALEEYVLHACYALTELHIPSSVAEIKAGALGNTSLTDIYFGGTDDQWNSIVIDPEYNQHVIPNANIHFQ